MDKRVPNEVFTVREVARAAGVPPDAVLALVESGAVRTVPVGGRTLYLDHEEAIRAGRRLVFERPTSGLFAPVSPREPALFQPLVQAPRPQVPFAISSAAHALLVATVEGCGGGDDGGLDVRGCCLTHCASVTFG